MRSILLLGFLVFAGALAGAATDRPGREIRILSWNVNKGKRLADIAQAIRALNPDLCLLQEVDANTRRTRNISVTDELATQLHYTPLFTPAYRELGQENGAETAWLGQSLLTRLPLKNSRKLAFESQSSFWKPKPWVPNWPVMQRREGGRVAQVSEVEAGERVMAVYNLHLESRSASAREGQLRETIQDARRYDAATPVVVAGDLNTHFHPERYAAQLRAAGFRNCFGEHQPRTHKLVGTVDWIFVRGPVDCADAAVHREVGASDHFPLTATLTIRETQTDAPHSNSREWQNKGTGKRSR